VSEIPLYFSTFNLTAFDSQRKGKTYGQSNGNF